MRPFSYGEKSEEKREMGFTAKVTTFSYDDAEPVSGQRMGTEVMIPSIPPGRLIIKEWAMPEKKYEINQMVIAIGTSDDNDIVLKDNAVSRHHAKIRVEGKKYFIYDMASTNGTRVNGRKITKKWIKEGDTIEVGRTMMIFKTEAPPSEIPEHKPSDLLKM